MAKRSLGGIEVVRTETKNVEDDQIRVKFRQQRGDISQTWWDVMSIEDYKKQIRYTHTPSEVNDAQKFPKRRFPTRVKPDARAG